MGADATIPIMSARAQVSYLRDEKNVSFELMGEEDAVAFLAERSFFSKLEAFAKDFEKYSCKPGKKGRYVNLDFGHLVELSKLDKTLRSLVLNLALDIEHYLKVRINAAAMRAGTDPFKVVDTFLVGSAASVVSEQTKALDMSASASAVRLATSTLERCDLESRPAIVSAANEATVALSKVTNGRDPWHVEHAIAGMAAPRTPGPSSGSTRTGRPPGRSSSSFPSARSRGCTATASAGRAPSTTPRRGTCSPRTEACSDAPSSSGTPRRTTTAP